jgi:exopolysaccharide biosynthesis polyprenyl glycosylphosphotransferase
MTIVDRQLLVDAAARSEPPDAGAALALQRRPPALLRSRQPAGRWVLAADVLGCLAAAVLGPLLVSAVSSNPTSAPGRIGPVVLFDAAMIPIFLVVFTAYGLYRRQNRRVAANLFADLKDIVHALIISGFVYAIVAYVASERLGLVAPSTAKIVAMCVAGAVTVPLARAGTGIVRRRVEGASTAVIVVGTGTMARTIASHLQARPTVNFLGYVDDDPLGETDVLGSLEDLPEMCRRYGVGRVVVCFSRTHPERTLEMLKSLAGEVAVSIVPRYYELITARSEVEDLFGLPMLDVAPPALSPGARFAKRAFDIAISSTVLLLASPFFLVTAILIKRGSPGPVLFRQERAGRGLQSFSVLKFRTMYDGAHARQAEILHLNEVDGPLFKVREDPRVTPIGRFLRRTSLDELPQMLNVLRGEMSLVGPRPFVVAEAEKIEGWARRRFEVRPGITGLWQVSGRNELPYLELCRLDYLYVASWSFWWDLQLLWQTPATVLGGRGAS